MAECGEEFYFFVYCGLHIEVSFCCFHGEDTLVGGTGHFVYAAVASGVDAFAFFIGAIRVVGGRFFYGVGNVASVLREEVGHLCMRLEGTLGGWEDCYWGFRGRREIIHIWTWTCYESHDITYNAPDFTHL